MLVSWSYPWHFGHLLWKKVFILPFWFFVSFFVSLRNFCQRAISVSDFSQQFWLAILVSDFGQQFWSVILVSDFGQRFWSAISVSDFGQRFWSAISVSHFGQRFWSVILVSDFGQQFQSVLDCPCPFEDICLCEMP